VTPSGTGGGPSLGCMVDKDAARAALRAFLVTRRARVSPAEAGLAVIGSRRRVPGLRREEVAMLAGISVEYYVRLERGQATGPSPSVVEGVAQALRLGDDERAHLDRLLTGLTPAIHKRRRRPVTETVSDGVQVVLNAMPTLPAVVQNARLDVLAVNALGRVLYAPVFDLEGPPNSARFLFLDEFRARQLFPQWERIADDTVALLRIEAGRHPEDRAMVELVGQLSTCSAALRTRWARNDVRAHNAGVKVFAHPVVGELVLPYENLLVDAAADHTLTVFTPRPGSPEHDAVQLLASWHAASRSDGVQPRER
jgi:transcriptional regulator with XRE-family HTH domain